MRLYLYIVSCIGILFFISSCQGDFVDGKMNISTVVNHFDNNNYIYGIRIKSNLTYILDDKNDSILRIYRNEDLGHPVKHLLKGTGRNELQEPSFCKEIAKIPYKGIRIVDNNYYLKIIDVDTFPLISSVCFINGLWNSTDYNVTSEDICALPFSPYKNSPFYFYNEAKGYHWVDPDKCVEKTLPTTPLSYSVSLSLNEKEEHIAVAYRYTNFISFYNLEGILEKSFFVNKNKVTPVTTQKGIDIEVSQKCFIGTYGTAKYVYCLYDGSADFSNNSQLYIYTWNGKHKATILLDRNIRTFAVSEDDSFILAVSRSERGGQDVLKYKL